jgi:multiple sugar transport system ATP-binding protein
VNSRSARRTSTDRQSGRILLAGEDVTLKRASARDIAFVFQLFALYPHMNVRRNIAFPLVSMGVKRAEVKTRVEEAARILRITELLDRPVSGLSGGDRQRVALGRAIVRRLLAFMMDEPLGALDSEFRQMMCGELRGLHDRLKATTVYVTHDQIEAMSLGDKIAVMSHGVIEQLGAPQEIYDRPASVFVADFIGSPPMNLLTFHDSLEPGRARVRVGGAEIAVPAPREGLSARDLILGVRPEHVRLNDQAPLRGEVFGTEYLGTTDCHHHDAAWPGESPIARQSEGVGRRLRGARIPPRPHLAVRRRFRPRHPDRAS